MNDTQEMDRGRFASPKRRGNEVHRRPQHDNSEVHRFLKYLEKKDFTYAPRFLGLTSQGAERLTYIHGETGYPPISDKIRSDDALASVARLVRAFHDASQGYRFSDEFEWHGYEWSRPARINCVGHFDLAPWNIVFEGSEAVGILDWDAVGPSNRTWDIAYVAYHFVPFHPTENLPNWGWHEEPDRRARLQLLISEYGLEIPAHEIVDSAVQRIYGVGAYIDQQVRLKNPAFEVQARDNHSSAFFKAAASLIRMRGDLIARTAQKLVQGASVSCHAPPAKYSSDSKGGVAATCFLGLEDVDG